MEYDCARQHDWLIFMFPQIPWAEAKENCEELYRGNGSLLSIISEKQWKDHKFIFERQGEGNSFQTNFLLSLCVPNM